MRSKVSAGANNNKNTAPIANRTYTKVDNGLVVTSVGPLRVTSAGVVAGIACGIVIDGELKRLDADRTTHLEPLVVDHGPDAVRCVCGLSGCLETIASGAVLTLRATQLGLGNNLGDIQRAAVDRDETATELILTCT